LLEITSFGVTYNSTDDTNNKKGRSPPSPVRYKIPLQDDEAMMSMSMTAQGASPMGASPGGASPVGTSPGAARRRSPFGRALLVAVPAVVLFGAMVADTKFVSLAGQDHAAAGFDPDRFGTSEFPKIQSAIVQKAVDAPTLARAVLADSAQAGKTYGVPGGIGPEIAVRFTGVAGNGSSGIYSITVPDVSPDIRIRVQTGPAINGTDLRDATGTIAFGQFTNQIDYQNAGAALNREMKRTVLTGLDTAGLNGKTLSVVGVFQMINPKSWLVTPVRMSVP
jgi:predicted lipoprotein